MVDVFLIIICIVFSILSIVVGLYVVVNFQHPEDKRTSWFSKSIVALAFGTSAMNVLLLPLDALNRSTGNTLNMTVMCWVFTCISAVLVFFVIPFTMSLYERLDDNTSKHPVLGAFLSVIPYMVFIIVFTIILYFAVKYCQVPIQVNLSELYDSLQRLDEGTQTTIVEDVWNVTPTFLSFFVAMLGFIGYLLLITLGAVGLVTLPLNLISKFVNRPRPISVAVYARAKQAINDWANDLLEQGRDLKKLVLAKGRNHRTVRKRYNRFEKQVVALQDAYDTVEVSYRVRGGNPIVPWIALFAGILAIVMSLLILIQIIVFYLLDVYPFLNNFLDSIDRVFAFGAVFFFALFVYYLYWCVLDGTASVGINIFMMRIHPMTIRGTPMTSLLFNSGVMIFASFGISLFACMLFPMYTRLTSLELLYGVQIQTLRGLKYVWEYGVYVMFGFILITTIYKLCTIRKKREDRIERIREALRKADTNI